MAKGYLSCSRLPDLTQQSICPRPHETFVKLRLYSVLPTAFKGETESYLKMQGLCMRDMVFLCNVKRNDGQDFVDSIFCNCDPNGTSGVSSPLHFKKPPLCCFLSH